MDAEFPRFLFPLAANPSSSRLEVGESSLWNLASTIGKTERFWHRSFLNSSIQLDHLTAKLAAVSAVERITTTSWPLLASLFNKVQEPRITRDLRNAIAMTGGTETTQEKTTWWAT